MSGTPKHSNSSRTGLHIPRAVKWPFLTFLVLAGLFGVLSIYTMVSEMGWHGLLRPLWNRNGQPAQLIQLKDQPIYQVKQKTELLGVVIQRIISKQQPQEFLLMEGVPEGLPQMLLNDKPDLAWVNLTANQLLKLRDGEQRDHRPLSVEIQSLKTTRGEPLQIHGQHLPYWQMEVQFKLSNESFPRHYRAGLLFWQPEQANKQAKKTGPSVLLLGYAARGAFEKQLIADFLQYLSWPGQPISSGAP